MTDSYRVLVTGSRDYTDTESMALALAAIQHEERSMVLVHGDARGADRAAAHAARSLGWATEAHPADWSRGRGAGPARNQHMVDLGADLCLAFPLPGSRGTWDCVRRAKAAGIPVHVHPEQEAR